MILLIGIMVFVPAVAHSCADMVLYLSTTHVSLRLGYSVKSGLENVQKIKNDINAFGLTDKNFDGTDTNSEGDTGELG